MIRWNRMTVGLCCVLLSGAAAMAQYSQSVVPTTMIVVLQGDTVTQDVAAIVPTDEYLGVGLLAENPATPEHRIGMTIECPEAYPSSPGEFTLQHSFFPDFPVQSWVQGTEGRVERLGKRVRGGRTSGFHIYTERRASEITRLSDLLLRTGARAGDGNVAWENTRSEAENEALRGLVDACLSRG